MKYNQQNSLGRNRMPRHIFFLRPLPCVTGTPDWLLRPMKASTSSELCPNAGLFFEWQRIQIFNSSHATYGTRCCARGHSHLYLGKSRISLGVAIILVISLYPHTQLDYNQFPVAFRFVFIHVKTLNILLVVKTLIKI